MWTTGNFQSTYDSNLCRAARGTIIWHHYELTTGRSLAVHSLYWSLPRRSHPPLPSKSLGSQSYTQHIISCLHHQECVAPLTASKLQSGRFSAIPTASVNVRLWDSTSFRTVLIHVIRGTSSSLFQSSGGSAVRIFLASALSSNRVICPNRERRRAWIR